MPEPVKLSRERWDSLTRGIKLDEKRVVITIRNSGSSALVTEPVEFNGITFLPATYVPDDVTWHRLPDPIRVEPASAANYPIVRA